VERLRAGELDLARVRLAAHVGDPAAIIAVASRHDPGDGARRRGGVDERGPVDGGGMGSAEPATLPYAVDIVAGLAQWGEAAAGRAALAALRATRPTDPSAWPGPWAETSPHVRTPRAADAALVAWLRDPTPARAAAGARLLQLPVAVSADQAGHWADEATTMALQLLSPLQWDVAHVAALPSVSARTAAEVVRAAIRAVAHGRPEGAADDAAARVLRAIRLALAPWALGEGDPLLAELADSRDVPLADLLGGPG